MVPGFEPLDFPGLSPEQKMAFIEAAFNPRAPGTPGFPAWLEAMRPVPGMRVNLQLISDPAMHRRLLAVGFKMRPYGLRP